jgi:hypothetical protein
MSRYTFEGKEANIEIVVGWDHPLQTFFVQVWDRERCDNPYSIDEPEFWAGAWMGEIRTVEDLLVLVEPYVVVPDEVVENLRRDYAGLR